MNTDTIRRETPRTAQDAAELLHACAADAKAVRIEGDGTKPWGRPGADCAVRLHTGALAEIVEHNAGDLTAVLQPGVSHARARARRSRRPARCSRSTRRSARATRRPSAASIAAADSGPLRHRYGAPRDLVLGVTVALSDGTIAHAGGKVIKNVAGYDLAKLFCGSFGTLGLIVEVAVRLHPRPPQQVDGDRHAPTTPRSSRRRRACSPTASSSCSRSTCAGITSSAPCSRASAASPRRSRRSRRARCWPSRASRPPSPRTTSRCGRRSARRSGRPTAARSCACRGARRSSPTRASRRRSRARRSSGAPASACRGSRCRRRSPGELVQSIARVRKVLAPSPCVVLDAPAYVRTHLDPWDHPEDAALVLMRRVKSRFDPTATCNPAIFVGGIS